MQGSEACGEEGSLFLGLGFGDGFGIRRRFKVLSLGSSV